MNHVKFSKLFLVSAWAAMIYVATGLPMRAIPERAGFTYYDKAIHIVLFAVFAYLLIHALKEWKRHPKHIYLAAFFASFSYAFISEYYQAFIPTRSPDGADLLAGVIGIFTAIAYDLVRSHKHRKNLLLHICCIGCGAFVSKTLQDDFNVALYFYNPNIFPKEEHDKRLDETKRIARRFGLKIIEGAYDHPSWLQMVRGREQDPEKGERCVMCYEERLEATARMARDGKYDFFTTTLTISPHKDARAVSSIGSRLERAYGVSFLDRDFKKKDGFRLSVKLSRELGLYRQEYCGCEFSRSYVKCEICR